MAGGITPLSSLPFASIKFARHRRHLGPVKPQTPPLPRLLRPKFRPASILQQARRRHQTPPLHCSDQRASNLTGNPSDPPTLPSSSPANILLENIMMVSLNPLSFGNSLPISSEVVLFSSEVVLWSAYTLHSPIPLGGNLLASGSFARAYLEKSLHGSTFGGDARSFYVLFYFCIQFCALILYIL